MSILNQVLRSKTSIVFALIAIAMFGSSIRALGDDRDSNEPGPELLTCNVLVVDPDGNPVQEATVYCSGLEGGGGLAFWNPESFGRYPN